MPAVCAPPEVVESYLLGVLTEPRREASFRFRTPGGEREFILLARGVEYLRVNEFLNQNIVHEVHTLQRDSDPQRIRDLLATLMYDKENASEVIHPTFLAALEERTAAVLEGAQVLVEVEPVYGAYVLLLAESVEWIETRAVLR
jgi:hypothetical protein